MVARRVDDPEEIGVAEHRRTHVECVVLVGGDDLDAVVGPRGGFPLAGRNSVPLVREVRVVHDRVLVPLDERDVRGAGLVLVRVHVVDHVPVLLVDVENGLLVPAVHLVGAGALVPFLLDPLGHLPAQNRDPELRIHRPGVRGQLEARGPGGVGELVPCAHGRRICAGRGVRVRPHLDLDVVDEGILTAEQHADKLPVPLRVLRLVVHQQIARTVATEHAEALVRQAVHVVGPHVVTVDHDLDRVVRRVRGRRRDQSRPQCHGGGRGERRPSQPALRTLLCQRGRCACLLCTHPARFLCLVCLVLARAREHDTTTPFRPSTDQPDTTTLVRTRTSQPGAALRAFGRSAPGGNAGVVTPRGHAKHMRQATIRGCRPSCTA